MTRQQEIALKQKERGFHLITDEVLSQLEDLPDMGILNLHLLHTSAGLTINENCDPTVRQDFESFFNHLVPETTSFFEHTAEGPDDMPAHIKASLVGTSLNIPISNRSLALGTWQGIYLCEFRNHPSQRKLIATILT
jgi:secondary thiamine-phosphate synthase enzyme